MTWLTIVSFPPSYVPTVETDMPVSQSKEWPHSYCQVSSYIVFQQILANVTFAEHWNYNRHDLHNFPFNLKIFQNSSHFHYNILVFTGIHVTITPWSSKL